MYRRGCSHRFERPFAASARNKAAIRLDANDGAADAVSASRDPTQTTASEPSAAPRTPGYRAARPALVAGAVALALIRESTRLMVCTSPATGLRVFSTILRHG